MSSRRSLAAAGAAFAVGIGYTDPGNWSTDFNAAAFGVSLLWSIIAAGLAAIVLQNLVVCQVSVVRGDLAAQIMDRWPGHARWLWPVYAVSIVATECAEFAGVALGIELVFHLPLAVAMAISAVAFLLLLLVRGTATVPLERFAIVTTLVLAGVYIVEWAIAKPPFGPIVHGSIVPEIHGSAALLAIIGIVGATIMPHNLFLQGGLIAEEMETCPLPKRARLETDAVTQTVVALVVATALNMTILIVASATHATSIEHGYASLTSLSGAVAAAIFGIALIMAGLAATATGARAGDFVFPAGAPIQLSPTVRRIASIVPAVLLLGFGMTPSNLLVGSQVVLGLALPFVIAPLLLLAFRSSIRTTVQGRALLAASVLSGVAVLACDVVYLGSLVVH